MNISLPPKFVIYESFNRAVVLSQLLIYRREVRNFLMEHKRLGSTITAPYFDKWWEQYRALTLMINRLREMSFVGFCQTMLDYYVAASRKNFDTEMGYLWHITELQAMRQKALMAQ